MRDHTKCAGGTRGKRKEALSGLLTLLVGICFIIVLFGAAHFDNTDELKGVIIAGAALAVSLVMVIVINIREERN